MAAHEEDDEIQGHGLQDHKHLLAPYGILADIGAEQWENNIGDMMRLFACPHSADGKGQEELE